MYAPSSLPPLFTNFRRTEMIKQINPDRDDPNWLDTEVGDVWNDIGWEEDNPNYVEDHDEWREIDNSIPRIEQTELRA